MTLSFSDDSEHSHEAPVPHANPDADSNADTTSGLHSFAQRIIDEYLQKGGTLEQFEALLTQYEPLAEEVAQAHQTDQREECVSLARNYWRATGVSAYMAGPVLELVRQQLLRG